MLSNQGIFRDTAFLIDKERKWEKKTIKQESGGNASRREQSPKQTRKPDSE